MREAPLWPLAQFCALLESLPPISRPGCLLHAQGVTLCWGYGASVKRAYPQLPDACFALRQRVPQHHFGLGHQGPAVQALNLAQAAELSRLLAQGGQVRWTTREAALRQDDSWWPLDPLTLRAASTPAVTPRTCRVHTLH